MTSGGVGAGSYGLRDNLPTLKDQVAATNGQLSILAEISAGLPVRTTWRLHSGNIWKTLFGYGFDGALCDVRTVTTPTVMALARAETLSDLGTLTNGFYFDPDEFQVPSIGRWDDSVSVWDATAAGDTYPTLYINLSGTDPNTLDISARLGILVASEAAPQPLLSADFLLGYGGFEEWTSPSNLTNWTETTAAGGAVNQSSDAYADSYSVELQVNNPGSTGLKASVDRDIAGSAGSVIYRLFGKYKNTSGNALAHLDLSKSTSHTQSDGRSIGAAGFNLVDTRGVWRHFFFDFVSPATAFNVKLAANALTNGAVGSVFFDEVECRRVYRWDNYRPRLTGSVDLRVGSNDVWFGGKQVGGGQVSIVNADGKLDSPFEDLDWCGAFVYVDLGVHNEASDGCVFVSDASRRGWGIVTSATLDDGSMLLVMDDVRERFYARKTALRRYTKTDFPNLSTQADGRVRPPLWGDKSNITPTRIDRTSDGYELYEVADVNGAPNGIVSIATVTLYLNADAAKAANPALSIELIAAGGHVTTDLANARFTVTSCVKPILLDGTNEWLTFNVGGADFFSSLYAVAGGVASIKTPKLLAAALQSDMNTKASVADITVTWSEVTKKLTIAKGAGTLNLKSNSGRQPPLFPTIGFATNADHTGSLSYLAENPLYVEANDIDTPLLLVRATGYKDDASGTYTGTANATIQKGPDVLRLFLTLLGLPQTIVHDTSFNAARTTAGQQLAVLLSADITLKDFCAALEISTTSDILVAPVAGRLSGYGVQIVWKPYLEGAAGGEPSLCDYHFSPFRSGVATTDTYRTVRVLYDQDPYTQAYPNRYQTKDSVATRYLRPDQRDFATYLKNGSDAQAAADSLARRAAVARVLPTATVRGALLLSSVGDKVYATRARAGAVGGKLSSVLHRILSVNHHLDQKTTDVTMVRDS